ncbi:hypothetical protein Tco_0305789, partial [Tanacetum coccineum]
MKSYTVSPMSAAYSAFKRIPTWAPAKSCSKIPNLAESRATISLVYSKDFNTFARYPNASNSAINLRSLVINTLMAEQSSCNNSIKDSSES